MNGESITNLRKRLKLNQMEFGNLLGVHPMTISKWERGTLAPNHYQSALMQEFAKAADKQDVRDTVGSLLLGAGIAAALLLLLSKAKE
jgi:putative transcriptional regulator